MSSSIRKCTRSAVTAAAGSVNKEGDRAGDNVDVRLLAISTVASVGIELEEGRAGEMYEAWRYYRQTHGFDVGFVPDYQAEPAALMLSKLHRAAWARHYDLAGKWCIQDRRWLAATVLSPRRGMLPSWMRANDPDTIAAQSRLQPRGKAWTRADD